MSFGDARGFGADEKESRRILEVFAEAGGNLIDTANKHHQGQSEEIVSSFLGPGRDRRVVATKSTPTPTAADPIAGVRRLEQLQDILGGLGVELPAEHLSMLDQVSRLEPGCPYKLLRGPQGQLVYGDLEAQIDLPPAAPYRWPS